MVSTSTVTLTDSESAWNLLKEFATDAEKANNIKLEFENFPKIKFNGPNFDAALPIRSMHALKAVQDEIYRIYALVVHNDETKTISRTEKDKLELFFHVGKGSADTEATNLIDILKYIIDKAAEKMEPKHYIIMVTSVVAVWQAGDVARTWVEQNSAIQREQITSQERTLQDEEETERLQIIRDIVDQKQNITKLIESVDRTNEALAKSVKEGESVVLPDSTNVTEDIAKELYPRNKRRTSVEIQMNDNYYITSFDRENDEIKIKIRLPSGEEYGAEASSTNQDLLDALAQALAHETIIYLQVNAQDFEGEKRNLVITGTTPPESVVQADN